MSPHQVKNCDSLTRKVLRLIVATICVLMVHSGAIVDCAEPIVRGKPNGTRSLTSIPLDTLDSLLSRNRSSVDVLLGPTYLECAWRSFFQTAGIKNWHMLQGYVSVNPRFIYQHASLFAKTGSSDEKTRQLFHITAGDDYDTTRREFAFGSVRRHQAFVMRDDSTVLVRVTKFLRVGSIDRWYYRLRPRLEITLFLGKAWSVTITDFRNSSPETVAGVGLERLVAAGRYLHLRLEHGGALNPSETPSLRDTSLVVKEKIAPSMAGDKKRKDTKSVKYHRYVEPAQAPVHMLLRSAAIFVPVDSNPYASYVYRTKYANHTYLSLASIDIVTGSMPVTFTYTEFVFYASRDYKYSPEAYTDEERRTEVVWLDKKTVAVYRRYESTDSSKSVSGYFTVYLTSPEIAVGLRGDADFVKSVFDRIVKIPDLAAKIVAARATPIGICGEP
jgi:hypothetical protein